MKSYAYQGEHTDERAIPGVGLVKSGAVITADTVEHAQAIEGTGLFKTVSAKVAAKATEDPPAAPDAPVPATRAKKE